MNAVMVVEDEQLIAKDIADTLTLMGYEVTGTVASAAECMASAKSRRPDLVLMDIHLDGDVDGIGTAQLLRDHFDIPVVFLSAYADDKTVSRAKLTGPLGYLLKPFRKSELRSAVEVALYRHQLERQLKERERWFSTTLRAIGDAVIAVNAQGEIAFMNRGAEALVKRSEAEVKGQDFARVFRLRNERTQKPVDNPVWLALREGRVVHLPPHTVLVVGDRDLPIDDTAAPIIDERGERLGAVIVMRDLSENRRVEQQIAQSDRLASLGCVAAGIAHEINNPLTYIMGNIGFTIDELDALRKCSLSLTPNELAPMLEESLTRLDDVVKEVEEGATRVSRIVADLGFFGRRDAKSRRGGVIAPLEWALRVSRASIAPHATVRAKLEPVPEVAGDEGRLGQLFLNLVLNAAYALREGRAETNELFVSTALSDAGMGQPHVVITIQDTGAGMTREVLDRIFDPFFTTKPIGAGTGLGLSVCHGVVQEMGGSISVRSTPGEGSTFVVRLPVADEPEPTPSSRRISSARSQIRG